jgi:inorganic pyrophosphatase
MSNLAKLDHQLDRKTGVCLAVIETPKGRRSKYDWDEGAKAFRLKTLLPDGMSFPLDFGFIPSTRAEDGDPIDVMVLMDEPAVVGAVLDVRLIGVIEAEETEHGRKARNDRLLAVAAVSHLYAGVKTPADLPGAFIEHLNQFWIQKAKLQGKEFRVLGVRDPVVAIDLVHKAAKAAKTGG